MAVGGRCARRRQCNLSYRNLLGRPVRLCSMGGEDGSELPDPYSRNDESEDSDLDDLKTCLGAMYFDSVMMREGKRPACYGLTQSRPMKQPPLPAYVNQLPDGALKAAAAGGPRVPRPFLTGCPPQCAPYPRRPWRRRPFLSATVYPSAPLNGAPRGAAGRRWAAWSHSARPPALAHCLSQEGNPPAVSRCCISFRPKRRRQRRLRRGGAGVP